MTLDVFGEVKKATETGDGPVDAIFKCIKKLYPHDVSLQLYQSQFLCMEPLLLLLQQHNHLDHHQYH